MSASSLLVEPAFHTAPAYDLTFGPEVADLCAQIGYRPDPEQAACLDDIFALNASRKKPAARTVCVIGARQNIKTGLFKQAVIGWLYVTDERLVVWSAHEFPTTKEAFRDLDDLITGSDMLRKRVKAIHRGNGDEAIELLGGQRVNFRARTKAGGRGLAAPKLILDEGFALRAHHMGSIEPVMSAQLAPQMLVGSSAGLADSDVLRGIRDRGRAGSDPALAYTEFCDDLPGGCAQPRCDHTLGSVGCRLDDEARWARANPQLGRRIEVDSIRAERRSMPPAEFARERLGWWDEPGVLERAIPEVLWELCADPGSQIVGQPRIAIDVSPAHGDASIGVAGHTVDGHLHVEVLATGRGTSWVAAEVARLQAEHGTGPVGYVKGSSAESLLGSLAEQGVAVVEVTQSQYAAACGELLARVTSRDRGLRHLSQVELDDAVANTGQRIVGDRSVWDRRRGGSDITPLCAVTTAAHLAVLEPQVSVYEERGLLII